MPPTGIRRSLDEIARLGKATYASKVIPTLRPEQDGLFVAVDIDTGEFEIDEDDYAAVMRLAERRPGAEIWLECVGQPTAHKMLRL